MTDTGHAPLPPSSAHLWVVCHGWRHMQSLVEPLPENETKTLEGEAAHWAVAEVLSGRQIDVGLVSPCGIALTDEMCEGADLMDDAVGPERSSLHVESTVNIGYVHPDNWGTPDAWRLFDNTLDVWDYKFGHRHVPAFENWQLLDYAAGVVTALRLPHSQFRMDLRIRLHIVQPRDYHSSGPVRSWVLSVEDLTSYADRLKAAAQANDGEGGDCVPGGHCRNCMARYACEALQSAALDHDTYSPMPLVLSNAALVRQRKLLTEGVALMQARLSGLDLQAMAALKRGENVPGLALEQGKGRERWNRPIPEILALGSMLGVNVSKPGALTPKQAVKAGVPADLVSAYTEVPVGELKLVEDDGSKARQAFAAPT